MSETLEEYVRKGKTRPITFRGFGGKAMEIVIKEGAGHDDIKILDDGKELCFMHICSRFIHVFNKSPKAVEDVYISLTGRYVAVEGRKVSETKYSWEGA